MAVIFMDGFDWYQGGGSGGVLSGDLAKRWTGCSSNNATISIGPSNARPPTGQGVLINNANGGFLYKSFGVNYTQGVMGHAVYLVGSSVSRSISAVLDGTTEQISVRTNSSGVLIVSRSGTTLATGSTVLSTNTWYYIELKFTINASTGVVELKLNGASEIASTSSLNTRNTSNTQWNGVGMQCNSGNNIQFDDWYVLDSSTGANTTFLGAVRIAPLMPAGAGNYAQWTPNGGTNFGSVSEQYEDGDTSFNQSSTANQIDSFVMQDAPSTSTVLAAQVITFARTTGSNTLAPLWRISSTDYVGTTVAPSSTYLPLVQVYDQSPATSSAWTASEIAGAEAGYKLIS